MKSAGKALEKLSRLIGSETVGVRAGCPEDVPSAATEGMTFISDGDLRESLLVDLGSAERSLNTGEWKACTVLSGSIIEALLLWVLQRHSAPEIAADLSIAGHLSASGKGAADPEMLIDDLIELIRLHPRRGMSA